MPPSVWYRARHVYVHVCARYKLEIKIYSRFKKLDSQNYLVFRWFSFFFFFSLLPRFFYIRVYWLISFEYAIYTLWKGFCFSIAPSLSLSLFLILFGRWSINFARWIFKRMLAMSLVIVHLFVMCCIMRDINNIIDVYRVVWSLGIKLILDFYNYSIYRDFLF